MAVSPGNQIIYKTCPYYNDMTFSPTFFIKVVVKKSKAYSFPIIGMMHLQKYYFQL